jgi:hypothetical protein
MSRRSVYIAAVLASAALVLFGSVWIVARFSHLFGQFLWVQRASDEPFYFWQLYLQLTGGAHDLNYRSFSKLLAMALLSVGASFDAMVTAYAIVNPLLVFAGALFLAATWEKRSVGRVVWALLLVFSFDFLSGSSRVIDYDPPAVWLAHLVGRPALMSPELTSYFVVQRRPEPQSSWFLFFPYLALLVASLVHKRRSFYLVACAVTPVLAVLYVSVAVVALLVFTQVSLYSIVFDRQRVVLPFVLSLLATTLAAGFIYVSGSTSAILTQSVIHTHAPILRPSIAFSLLGLVWAGLSIARNGFGAERVAALIMFGVPMITLNQQLLTGLAIMPSNWEFNANYICLVAGAGLMSANRLSALEERRGFRQFIPAGLWALIAFYVVQGELRNEVYWSAENVQSVLFSQLISDARKKTYRVDAVILPRVFDESLFVTRSPKGPVVLGGYDRLIMEPLPVWRDEQTFDDHMREVGDRIQLGFETLFRSGFTPEELEANMLADIRTGDCWTGLGYFFSLNDCWPAFSNHQSPGTKRLSSAVPRIVEMYRRYLERDARGDLARRHVLLLRTEPLPEAFQGLGIVENELVASREVEVHGARVRAYAYLQRGKAQ